MRRTVRALVLAATVALLIVGGVHTSVLLRNQYLRKQPATAACLTDTRQTIGLFLAELTPQQIAVAEAGTRFGHVSGRTTGLAEDDGDRALSDSHKTRADILAVWEFSGHADIPGPLPIGESNHSTFSCNAVVFTDHSVVTYGIDVTPWHPGDVIG